MGDEGDRANVDEEMVVHCMNLSNILSCRIVQWTPKYFQILEYGLLSSISMVLRINGWHVFAIFAYIVCVCVCVYSFSIQLSSRFGCHRSNRQNKKLFMFLCWHGILL